MDIMQNEKIFPRSADWKPNKTDLLRKKFPSVE
jgi:hypothetical protein